MICPDLITGSVHLSVRVREIQMCHTGVHGYALLCIMYILLKFWKKFIEFRLCTQYQIDNCLCKEKLTRIKNRVKSVPPLLFRPKFQTNYYHIYIYMGVCVFFFFLGGGGGGLVTLFRIPHFRNPDAANGQGNQIYQQKQKSFWNRKWKNI